MELKQIKRLEKNARNALRNSYGPYSRFRVGCALLAASGNLYTGCNIENASYGLTICAERVALFNAISHGEREFNAIAIVSEKDRAYPCGACLQVMSEFAPDLVIIIFDNKHKIKVVKLKELLPKAFVIKNKKHKQ
jgi:cytidine deaminase